MKWSHETVSHERGFKAEPYHVNLDLTFQPHRPILTIIVILILIRGLGLDIFDFETGAHVQTACFIRIPS
jgi:hypothetical protein